MKMLVAAACLLLASPMVQPLSAQSAPADRGPDLGALQPLAFLVGNWEAKTPQNGAVQSAGTYAFQPELNNHVLARHTVSKAGCKGPATFDCEHTDLLYVFQDAPGEPLKAIYFDNEGHVLHYAVTTPDATTAVFLTDPAAPGPQFKLVYELKAAVMTGKFQMKMPGQTEWKSYLEWSGAKK